MGGDDSKVPRPHSRVGGHRAPEGDTPLKLQEPALNLGYSGDRTENVLWRITEGRELDGYEAKAIVLLVGTDNLAQRGDCAGDVISGIWRILQAIREKQPKARVVLCAILPRGQKPDAPHRAKIATVNREIQKFADGRGVIWCDCTDLLTDAEGFVPTRLMLSYVELSSLGAIAFTSAVMPQVNAILRDDGLPVAPR